MSDPLGGAEGGGAAGNFAGGAVEAWGSTASAVGDSVVGVLNRAVASGNDVELEPDPASRYAMKKGLG
jgi:hypothetical protein